MRSSPILLIGVAVSKCAHLLTVPTVFTCKEYVCLSEGLFPRRFWCPNKGCCEYRDRLGLQKHLGNKPSDGRN